jgi:hypothetical protein
MFRRSLTLALLLLLALAAIVRADDGSGARDERRGDTRLAHHGMWAGQAECGTRVWRADLTKGRTDSMLFHARHTAGCYTYDYTNYAPAGIGESQGNTWQMAECARMRDDVVRYFDYYAHVTISADDVQYTCRAYSGPD